MLLAFTALASTSIALTTELALGCAGRRAWLMRPGPLGVTVRRLYLGLDRSIPLFTGITAAASIVLAVLAGVTTRSGCIGLAGVLALGAHGVLYAEVARRFRTETQTLGLAWSPPKDLAAFQARWELAMSARASLLAAAFVCVVAATILG